MRLRARVSLRWEIPLPSPSATENASPDGASGHTPHSLSGQHRQWHAVPTPAGAEAGADPHGLADSSDLFFVFFFVAAISTNLPAFLIYRSLWPSLYFEARQEINPHGLVLVLETALTLGVAGVRAAADRLAREHRVKVTAAPRSAVFLIVVGFIFRKRGIMRQGPREMPGIANGLR